MCSEIYNVSNQTFFVERSLSNTHAYLLLSHLLLKCKQASKQIEMKKILP